MTIASTIQRYLTEKTVDYDLIAHPHTNSSHETALAAHIRDDHIAKAVLVREHDYYAMVVIPASGWVRMKHLRRELNRDLHLASEREAAHVFSDCEAGALPPLGPAYGLETYLDESLTSLADVYFEAGDHQELVHTRGEDFQRLLGGVRRGHYSNEH